MSVALQTAAGQKRARQQLSCTFCRSQKLRCNRERPCDQCMKRSRCDDCSYLAAPPKKPRNKNTRDRIAHLEGLVVQLINQGNGPKLSKPDTKASPGSSNSDHSASVSDSSTLKDSPNGSHEDTAGDATVALGELK